MTLRTKRERAKAANHYAQLFGAGPVVDVPEKRMRHANPDVPTEHAIQCSVIAQWYLMCRRFGLPPFALFAVPNGGARDPITGARLKAEGVRPGIPDLQLAVKRGGYCGLFIEMKRPGAKDHTTDAQDEVLEYLRQAGYLAAVCDSAEQAISTIKAYLA